MGNRPPHRGEHYVPTVPGDAHEVSQGSVSQPWQALPMPISSRGIISRHAEKPHRRPSHTTQSGEWEEGRGPPCSGNRAVTTNPGTPPALSLRQGHCSHPRLLAETLLPQLESVPGLGLQNAPMPEPAPRVSLPAWAPEPVIFHSWDQ